VVARGTVGVAGDAVGAAAGQARGRAGAEDVARAVRGRARVARPAAAAQPRRGDLARHAGDVGAGLAPAGGGARRLLADAAGRALAVVAAGRARRALAGGRVGAGLEGRAGAVGHAGEREDAALARPVAGLAAADAVDAGPARALVAGA